MDSHGSPADSTHEPPRGAFLITVLYLVLLAVLWGIVYLDLLAQGGLPAR